MKKSKHSSKTVKGGGIDIPFDSREFQILFGVILFSLFVLVFLIPKMNKFNKDKQFIFINQLENPDEMILVPSYIVKYGTEVSENDIKTKVQDLQPGGIVLVRVNDIQEHFTAKHRVLNPQLVYSGSDDEDERFTPCSEEIFEEVGYLKSINCVQECKKIGASIVCS